MISTQSANEAAPTNKLICSRCNIALSPQAVLCSFCGKRVGVQTNREQGSQVIQESRPIYRAGLSRIQLKHRQPDQQPQNEVTARQFTKSSPLPQYLEFSMGTTLKLHAVKTQSADVAVQRKVPIAGELPQLLPDTYIEDLERQSTKTFPSVSPVPQHKAVLNPSLSMWVWPMSIILSALAVGLIIFVMPHTIVRSIAVMGFLFVCPGMVAVRFLHLEKPIVEWTLAIALSFAIDAIVASLLLYAGRWSPTGILGILIGFSVAGAIVQLALLRSTTTKQRIDAFRRSFRRAA